MIGYVTLGTNDLPRAVAFYDALLGTLGAKRWMESARFVAWTVAADKPALGVILPYDGKPATVGNGVMVALAVDSHAKGRHSAQEGPGVRWQRRGRARFTRRFVLWRLLSRPRRQQTQRVLHGLKRVKDWSHSQLRLDDAIKNRQSQKRKRNTPAATRNRYKVRRLLNSSAASEPAFSASGSH